MCAEQGSTRLREQRFSLVGLENAAEWKKEEAKKRETQHQDLKEQVQFLPSNLLHAQD